MSGPYRTIPPRPPSPPIDLRYLAIMVLAGVAMGAFAARIAPIHTVLVDAAFAIGFGLNFVRRETILVGIWRDRFTLAREVERVEREMAT